MEAGTYSSGSMLAKFVLFGNVVSFDRNIVDSRGRKEAGKTATLYDGATSRGSLCFAAKNCWRRCAEISGRYVAGSGLSLDIFGSAQRTIADGNYIEILQQRGCAGRALVSPDIRFHVEGNEVTFFNREFESSSEHKIPANLTWVGFGGSTNVRAFFSGNVLRFVGHPSALAENRKLSVWIRKDADSVEIAGRKSSAVAWQLVTTHQGILPKESRNAGSDSFSYVVISLADDTDGLLCPSPSNGFRRQDSGQLSRSDCERRCNLEASCAFYLARATSANSGICLIWLILDLLDSTLFSLSTCPEEVIDSSSRSGLGLYQKRREPYRQQPVMKPLVHSRFGADNVNRTVEGTSRYLSRHRNSVQFPSHARVHYSFGDSGFFHPFWERSANPDNADLDREYPRTEGSFPVENRECTIQRETFAVDSTTSKETFSARWKTVKLSTDLSNITNNVYTDDQWEANVLHGVDNTGMPFRDRARIVDADHVGDSSLPFYFPLGCPPIVLSLGEVVYSYDKLQESGSVQSTAPTNWFPPGTTARANCFDGGASSGALDISSTVACVIGPVANARDARRITRSAWEPIPNWVCTTAVCPELQLPIGTSIIYNDDGLYGRRTHMSTVGVSCTETGYSVMVPPQIQCIFGKWALQSSLSYNGITYPAGFVFADDDTIRSGNSFLLGTVIGGTHGTFRSPFYMLQSEIIRSAWL